LVVNKRPLLASKSDAENEGVYCCSSFEKFYYNRAQYKVVVDGKTAEAAHEKTHNRH
jgi:hypothetical protein